MDENPEQATIKTEELSALTETMLSKLQKYIQNELLRMFSQTLLVLIILMSLQTPPPPTSASSPSKTCI